MKLLNPDQLRAAVDAISHALAEANPQDTKRVAIWLSAPSSGRRRDRCVIVCVPRERAHDADEYAATHHAVFKEMILGGFEVHSTKVLDDLADIEVV